MTSPARQQATLLATLGDAPAHVALDLVIKHMTVTELALLMYDWRGTWARDSQLIPDSRWRSFGFLTARRVGKTRSIAEWINEQIYLGRCGRMGFAAQNDDKAEEVLVNGDSGLIATAPPWFRPRWVAKKLLWPNGARGDRFTPEKPGNFRGPGLNIFWASEIQSWPTAKMEEAFMNAELMTSQGRAQLVWDATPKRRHPLIRGLLERSEQHPDKHIIRRGRIEENADNLGDVIDDLRRRFGNTRRGREELDGEFLDEDEGALWEQKWIDDNRRNLPTATNRRIISIDPAISDKRSTDATGFCDLALGTDDQIYVIDDYTKHYEWSEWGGLACRLYLKNKCDCIVVERNRGGDACRANIKACGEQVGQNMQLVKPEATTRHRSGTIYVKEIFASKAKGIRAEPVATLYEQGRVSHCYGHDLMDLEDSLTTWDPAEDSMSPNALDAMVHGCWELADLRHTTADYAAGFKGLDKVAEKLGAAAQVRGLHELLGGGGGERWGGKF